MAQVADERIFITGGLGFIGAWLGTRLVEHNQVTVYDCFRRNALRYSPAQSHANLTVVKGSVLDTEHLAKAMAQSEPTIVIHLAAITGVPNYTTMPVSTIRTNMEGTARVLECALAHDLKRFVNFSTSEVYGPDVRGAREDGATSQGPVGCLRWSYAVSKIAAEHLCMAYYHKRMLPIVSLRPFNIYGPWQVGEGAVHSFVSAAIEGRDLQINGDGSQVRAWCYVADLVDAACLAMARDEAVGEVINIGNPAAELTIIELAERVVEACESSSRLAFASGASVEITMRTPCIEKAQRLLGYTPEVSFDEGLRQTIEWYRHAPIEETEV